MSSNSTRVAFTEKNTRNDEMHQTIEDWVEELSGLVDKAAASEEFQSWLDVQTQFHDYSYRNTLLIKQQCPQATTVAGYRTWQEEFDRHVREGESAIWIWAPIIAKRCPKCENSPSYHENIDCDYDETPPDEWSTGLVGFRPAPIFDVSQTEGEPLPELETSAAGDGEKLVSALLEAAEAFDIVVRIIPEDEWEAGEVDGICRRQPNTGRPRVEVKADESQATLAGVLIHEYAHALLHVGVEDTTERPKREVEAEAVAYVVGRHFGLDMDNSAFYLAAWQGEDTTVLQERLGRISQTASDLIEALEPTEGSS